MPHVRLDADGVERWYIGDRNCGSLGGNVIRADNNKLLGRLAFPTLDEAHPGGHLVPERPGAYDASGACDRRLRPTFAARMNTRASPTSSTRSKSI